MYKVQFKYLKSVTSYIATIFLLCCVLTPLSVGCNRGVDANNNTPEDVIDMPELDKEIEQQIMQDWQDQFEWALPGVSHYYGTHKGYVIFAVSGRSSMVENESVYIVDNVLTYFKVTGVIFKFSVDTTIYTWKEGVFITMTDAYLDGLLSSQDIKNIGTYHVNLLRKNWVGDDKSFNEWYFDEKYLANIIE
jgi:hypothetical protein